MTIREIRSKVKEMIRFSKNRGHVEMVAYYSEMAEWFERLYKNLWVAYYPQEFLSLANGYQINTGNYDTFNILQTHDLHMISCDSKKEARKFFEWWVLN